MYTVFRNYAEWANKVTPFQPRQHNAIQAARTKTQIPKHVKVLVKLCTTVGY